MNQPNERVLYYGLAGETQEKLFLNLLADLNLQGRLIRQHELGRSVGELAGSNASDQQQDPSGQAVLRTPTESIIVMAGLGDAKINALLAGIRQTANLRITLKAVLTEHNRSWTFTDLVSELRQEHAYMQVYMALQQVVHQAEQQLTHSENQLQLQAIIINAKKVLNDAQRGEADLRQMADIGRELAGFLI